MSAVIVLTVFRFKGEVVPFFGFTVDEPPFLCFGVFFFLVPGIKMEIIIMNDNGFQVASPITRTYSAIEREILVCNKYIVPKNVYYPTVFLICD